MITCQLNLLPVQAIHVQINKDGKRQTIDNRFAVYIHTVLLEELIESVEQTRSDVQPRYVVIYGAACSYCLSIAKKLEGSYLRTLALELKEQLAQALAVFVMSILTQPLGGFNTKSATEPRFPQIIEALQRVTCHETQRGLRFRCSESKKNVSAKSVATATPTL